MNSVNDNQPDETPDHKPLRGGLGGGEPPRDKPDESPYLAARREWLERYGDYIADARRWRITAYLALVLALVALAGFVVMSTGNHVVPYVVEVDKLGSTAAIAPAEPASPVDNRVIRAGLAGWIGDMRTVYLDAAAERALINRGYAMTAKSSAAYGAVNDYFRGANPFDRAKHESVDVEVRTVLPVTADTWRVEWQENTRARDGTLVKTAQFQATMTIKVDPPKDESVIRLNPVGLYVTAFNWSDKL